MLKVGGNIKSFFHLTSVHSVRTVRVNSLIIGQLVSVNENSCFFISLFPCLVSSFVHLVAFSVQLKTDFETHPMFDRSHENSMEHECFIQIGE